MDDKLAYSGITFDDVLLEPRYSEFVPSEVDVATQLTQKIRLRIPLLSSPMDTVTESEMAIALAKVGGLGVIHKNLSIENQVEEVVKVKRSANGIIPDPVTLTPSDKVTQARDLMDQQNVSGVPIVDSHGKLVGILTRRDLRFLESSDLEISQVMTRENLVTATGSVTLEQAEKILTDKKVEKLLLVDDQYKLTGLITIKDIDMMKRYPNACKDELGRLRVGAAIGVHDFERAEQLIDKGVDILIVDSAHGHSANVLETVRQLKKRWSIDVIAGNVATEEGGRDLVKAGADAVKVGIGPGSICTTRVISGVGVPQITAIYNVAKACQAAKVPVIADGGIRFSGDITKAIAAGAHCVMIGGLFAGLAESPGRTILYQGRTFKSYRGMGSLGAMVKGSSERYRQAQSESIAKLVPEGVEGRVPFKGPLSDFVYQLVGGLRAGMGYCGTRTIEELRRDAKVHYRYPPRLFERTILMTSPSRRKHPTTAQNTPARNTPSQRRLWLLSTFLSAAWLSPFAAHEAQAQNTGWSPQPFQAPNQTQRLSDAPPSRELAPTSNTQRITQSTAIQRLAHLNLPATKPTPSKNQGSFCDGERAHFPVCPNKSCWPITVAPLPPPRLPTHVLWPPPMDLRSKERVEPRRFNNHRAYGRFRINLLPDKINSLLFPIEIETDWKRPIISFLHHSRTSNCKILPNSVNRTPHGNKIPMFPWITMH